MAIYLMCSTCKSTSSLKSRYCKKCGHDLKKRVKYRVVVSSHDGKRVSKVLDSITMAKKLEAKLTLQSMEKTLFGINHSPLIDEIWVKYIKWAKDNKKSWKDDQSRWQHHVKPFMSGKRMDVIISFDIEKVISNMKSKRNYAPATIRQTIVLIKRIFNWAADMGLYEGKNPASRIKLPKLNNEVTECLTRDEIRNLMRILDGWVNQMVALLIKFTLLTGLRRGEVFKLRWENVDIDNKIIYLRDTKGGKDEALPISDEALKMIKRAKKLLPSRDCPFVFPNKWGNQRNSFGNTWTRIKEAASLPEKFRFHGLRHTFASYLASSGKVSPLTLQRLLTHKSPQMTQRYTHLFDETLREGANLLPTLF